MKCTEAVNTILKDKKTVPKQKEAKAFAPANVALIKYWGKRNTELNLPVTNSLSISLGHKGATTTIRLHHENHDQVYLNQNPLANTSTFSSRLLHFLDLFRPTANTYFHIDTQCNIPIAAGLASSACGFASLVLALNDFFQWQLTLEQLSVLARLGSGSACRSLWNGFVEWQYGNDPNGLDSHGIHLPNTWPELRIGLLIFHAQQKPLSSRKAMQQTIETSMLYQTWPDKVTDDLAHIKTAITNKDFSQLGKTAENNALTMHALMQSAWPPILYSLPETLAAMKKIWYLREKGHAVYFTQDAGPNLKLLFLEKDCETVKQHFPQAEIIIPFNPNAASLSSQRDK